MRFSNGLILFIIFFTISILIIISFNYYFADPFGIFECKTVESYVMDKPGIYKIKYLFKDKYSKTVPIIMYHHIETDENKITSRTVSPEKLKKDLKQIKDLKYTTITFKDLSDYVATYKDLPDKPIIITFDDGYLSNYEYAYPILKELNMKATIFIVGIMAGKDNFNGKEALPHFSYEQAKEMYESA
jgi:hypothetical protein